MGCAAHGFLSGLIAAGTCGLLWHFWLRDRVRAFLNRQTKP